MPPAAAQSCARPHGCELRIIAISLPQSTLCVPRSNAVASEQIPANHRRSPQGMNLIGSDQKAAVERSMLFVLLEFIGQPQTECPRADDRIHLDPFDVARERDPPCIADVASIDFRGPGTLGDTNRRVIGRKPWVVKGNAGPLECLAQLVGRRIGPTLVRCRELPERPVFVDWELVANADVALERGQETASGEPSVPKGLTISIG